MSALSVFCTTAASTKRSTDLGSGLTGAAAAYLTGLLITPLWPLSPETIESLGISSPRESKECFFIPAPAVALPDIREGDVLVVGGVDYPIDSVSEWTAVAGLPACLRIVVQAVKLSWPTVAAP